MDDEVITKHKIDEGRDDELESGKYEREIEDDELEKKIEQAKKRLKARLEEQPAEIWKPKVGEIKAVEVLRVEQREGEYKDFEVFILKDLKNKKLFNLVSCGILKKHLHVGEMYLLRYGGKIDAEVNGEIRQVHHWDWEKI